MKKLFAAIAICFALASTAAAQQQNALGLHLGYGVEISYQRMLSSTNRLEVNLGMPGFSYFGLGANYQWVNEIPTFPKGFGWYYGVGGQLGAGASHFHLGVTGVIGIEYTIPTFPLQFSIDYAPVIGFQTGHGTGFYGGWFGFNAGIRYKF